MSAAYRAPGERAHLSSIPPWARKASAVVFAVFTLAMLFVLSPVALGIVIALFMWERGQ